MSNQNIITNYLVEVVRVLKEAGAPTEAVVAGVQQVHPIAHATVEAVSAYVQTGDAEAFATALDAIPFPARPEPPAHTRTSG